MKRLIIALALALVACAQDTPPLEADYNGPPDIDGVMLPLSDEAGNRMEALVQGPNGWCSADGAWCAASSETGTSVSAGGAVVQIASEGELWPVVTHGANGALFGIITTNSQMYSGGSGEAKHLTLYEVANGGAREVLRLPYSGSAMIRACFDEADQTDRAGACHDEYAFVTRFFIDETVTSGAPVLILETAAGSYPGAQTRMSDSTTQAPLTEADLLWARDEMCSFRRTYTRGPDDLYAPDQPLPGCADYLEP